METSPSGSTLDETADVVDAFAGQEQDGRHIDQRIRTGTPGLGRRTAARALDTRT